MRLSKVQVLRNTSFSFLISKCHVRWLHHLSTNHHPDWTHALQCLHRLWHQSRHQHGKICLLFLWLDPTTTRYVFGKPGVAYVLAQSRVQAKQEWDNSPHVSSGICSQVINLATSLLANQPSCYIPGVSSPDVLFRISSRWIFEVNDS